MKNSLAIAKKELNIYFATPIAYVMFTLFVVIGSYFFLRLLGAYEQASLRYMQFNSPEMIQPNTPLNAAPPSSPTTRRRLTFAFIRSQTYNWKPVIIFL